MEELLGAGKVLRTFPIRGYWLDIGNHDDYQKAQIDFDQIHF
jgi:NDP-sugar pyrophosphorylase family protein